MYSRQIDIATAGIIKIFDDLTICGSNVFNQLVFIRVDRNGILAVVFAEKFCQQLRRCRESLARNRCFVFKLLYELVVFDERMIFARNFARYLD